MTNDFFFSFSFLFLFLKKYKLKNLLNFIKNALFFNSFFLSNTLIKINTEKMHLKKRKETKEILN